MPGERSNGPVLLEITGRTTICNRTFRYGSGRGSTDSLPEIHGDVWRKIVVWFASTDFIDMSEVIPPGFSRVGMREPKNIIVHVSIATALKTNVKTVFMSRHFVYGQRMSPDM